jgi:hypothetical protein
MQHSPSFMGELQCNGVIDGFMRTLKEQRLWLHRFAHLAHTEREIGAVIERYNEDGSWNVNSEWLTRRTDASSVRKGGLEPQALGENPEGFRGPDRQEPPSTPTKCVRRTHLRGRRR